MIAKWKLFNTVAATAIALGTAIPANADDKATTVAFLAGVVGDPFYTSMECGARKAAKEFNVDLSWSGPTEWDIAKQQPFIDAALELKPQGVILAPTDGKALITLVKQLQEAGTPVVTVDAPLDEPVELQSIQSNHLLGGEAAAEAMMKVAGEEGTFLVLGLRPGLPDIDARVNGFVEALKKNHPKAKLLPVAYPETNATKAAQQVAAAIQANPDLKGVYATHFAAATGASAALLEAGKKGEIKLVSFDAAPQQVRDLKDGVYDALIVQKPYSMGYDAVKLVSEVARNTVDRTSVAHDNFLPFVIATRDNIEDKDVAGFFYLDKCVE